MKNGKNESIIKKADCHEKAGIADLFISFSMVLTRLYIL